MALPQTVAEEIQQLLSQGTDLALQRARQKVRQQLQHFPYDALLHHLHAWVLQRAGVLDESLAAAKTAVTLAPEAGAFHHTLGIAYLAVNQLDQAIPAFAQAVALLDPKADPLIHFDAVAHLAYTIARQGTPASKELLRQLVAQAAQTPVLRPQGLPLLALAALRAGALEWGLNAVVAFWLHTENNPRPPEWATDIPAIPQRFLQEQFGASYPIVRPGQPDLPMGEALRLVQDLLAEGAGQEEVLAALASYLADPDEDEAEDADLIERARQDAAGGHRAYQPGQPLDE